jgi:dipeptidyl aminopeptidase/acylaminoacyl peptidase
MTKSTGRRWIYPIDRTAWILIVLLSLAIAFLVWKGDRTAPRVRDFTWQNRQVGTEDTAFMMTFSRPMDHASVEKNLQIKPVLPGKFSWAGRRMAYTLDTPAPYGETYKLELQGARDRFSQAGDERTQMTLFTGQFKTRDRAFVYLGVEGEEEGRLVLQNLTQQKQQILTPKNLTVIDFKPYPDGDRILFSASDRAATKGTLDQQIYTVTTGVALQTSAIDPGESSRTVAAVDAAPGVVTPVLDNKDYQNLRFDLSPNGKIVIVQRVNKTNPGDSGIWMIKDGTPAQPIKTEPGGDFLIAPDSTSLAMSQGQGMAILPLEADGQRLDFLPKFGIALSFAPDGAAAAMVKFNRDPANPTRSLFLVTNQGVEKELLKTDGNILSAEFDPTRKNLYCLVTKRLPGKDYVEQPYLVSINLATGKRVDLLRLPVQRDIQMSLAPDGLGILFDQVTAADDPKAQKGAIRNSEGKAIEASRLWFFPILTNEANVTLPGEPQELGVSGLRPRWLP